MAGANAEPAKESGTVIPDAVWRNAMDGLRRSYRESAALPLCLSILERFAEVNRTKYRTDLAEYLHESKPEDFATAEGGTVLVGTMHGAKGREFDRVDLVLKGYDFREDEKKRVVYVAMTRARNALTIHTDGTCFDGFAPIMSETVRVTGTSGEPERLLIPMTHRDVDLGWFKGKEERTMALRAGDRLTAEGKELRTSDGRTAARFSRAFQMRIGRLREKGYEISDARIRFVLAWKGKEEPKETAILLPEIEAERVRDAPEAGRVAPD